MRSNAGVVTGSIFKHRKIDTKTSEECLLAESFSHAANISNTSPSVFPPTTAFRIFFSLMPTSVRRRGDNKTTLFLSAFFTTRASEHDFMSSVNFSSASMDLMPPFEFNVLARDSEKRSPDSSIFATEAAGLKSSSIELCAVVLLEAALVPDFVHSLSSPSSSSSSSSSSSFSPSMLF